MTEHYSGHDPERGCGIIVVLFAVLVCLFIGLLALIWIGHFPF